MAKNKYKNLQKLFIFLIVFIWLLLTIIVDPFGKKSETGNLYSNNPHTARELYRSIDNFYIGFSIVAALLVFFLGRKLKKAGVAETTEAPPGETKN